ncbi:MAG: FeoB-associated Cys-rich membrane protein [Oscillospiraceae bacterium]|nr:FeoB-associated Cys-rich membrane protein [Oscillospiraceae bacterium]
MFTWLSENAGTLIISLVLAAVVAAILISIRRNRKAGKTSCGCGCAGCAMHDACHGGKQ